MCTSTLYTLQQINKESLLKTCSFLTEAKRVKAGRSSLGGGGGGAVGKEKYRTDRLRLKKMRIVGR